MLGILAQVVHGLVAGNLAEAFEMLCLGPQCWTRTLLKTAQDGSSLKTNGRVTKRCVKPVSLVSLVLW